jgi:hypothetical protein
MQLRVVSCCEKRKNEADLLHKSRVPLRSSRVGGREGGRARSIAEPEVSFCFWPLFRFSWACISTAASYIFTTHTSYLYNNYYNYSQTSSCIGCWVSAFHYYCSKIKKNCPTLVWYGKIVFLPSCLLEEEGKGLKTHLSSKIEVNPCLRVRTRMCA